jgi:radical SAM superfamily enzyme YgiQ (UPF0313 family)
MLVSFAGYPHEIFNLMPDNGLANLAACLREAGHETVICDCSTIKMMEELYPRDEVEELGRIGRRVVERVDRHGVPDERDVAAFRATEERIDDFRRTRLRELGREMGEKARREGMSFVGFKLWTGAGFEGSIILAEEIRKAAPNVKIFGGGPHVDLFMQRSVEVTDAFDVLAYGEGEEVIVQLAEYAKGRREIEDVSNAIYRRGGGIIVSPQSRVGDLDAIPLPCYDEDFYPAMRGDEKIKVVLLDESRGCPNSCSFCIHPLKSGRKRRTATAKAFVDRMEQIIDRYGFRSFRLAGSNPPASLRRQIAEEILRRGLDVAFSAFAHVRDINADDFSLLGRAGCKALAFGVESGSQRILDESMNKRVRVDEIKHALLACKEADIDLVVSIIVPAPGETEATKDETFALLAETRPDSTVVSFPVLMPGTAWEKEQSRFGFAVRRPDELWKKLMTYQYNVLAPPDLWCPVEDYTLDGKPFRAMAAETGAFVRRLRDAGLTTQLFDQVSLIARLAEMPPAEFGMVASRLIRRGNTAELRGLVQRVNGNVRCRSGFSVPSLPEPALTR